MRAVVGALLLWQQSPLGAGLETCATDSEEQALWTAVQQEEAQLDSEAVLKLLQLRGAAVQENNVLQEEMDAQDKKATGEKDAKDEGLVQSGSEENEEWYNPPGAWGGPGRGHYNPPGWRGGPGSGGYHRGPVTGGTYVHHNPPGWRGGPGHGSTYVHHNPPGWRGGPGRGTTAVHHHGRRWLLQEESAIEGKDGAPLEDVEVTGDADAKNSKEAGPMLAESGSEQAEEWYNPPGPVGGPGSGHYNPPGWRGGPGSGGYHRGPVTGGTYVHHNAPGPVGGPGHGSTYVHHNPPGWRGGPGRGTTVVHHHGRRWLLQELLQEGEAVQGEDVSSLEDKDMKEIIDAAEVVEAAEAEEAVPAEESGSQEAKKEK